MKALTFKQYRTANIILLTLIFVIAESAVTLGANLWFRELPYVLSLAVLFVSLEMMRWHGYAAVAALAMGLAFCAASGAAPTQYLIYCVGNLFMLFGLFFLKKAGRDKVRASALLSIGYVLIVFLLAQLGRWIVSLFFGADLRMLVQFVTTDALSALFAVIAVLIVRNIEGVFEDQKSYLLRLEAERREEAGTREEDYRH